MPFHDPAKRSFKELTPEIRVRTFWGESMTVAVVNLEANALLPKHSHPHEQSSYIIEGELEFTIGDETSRVRAGELVIIPGGVEHFVKVGPAPAKVLDVFCPIREDLKY